mgnify:CR=1 FL=1
MQVVSTTPSLFSYTRVLAGDPESAASEVWTDARVKAAINDAYLEMREMARVFGEGSEVKRSYATTVADQLWYQLPSDFKRLILCEISATGDDLSADNTPTVLKPLALDTALEGYETGAFSSSKYVALADGHLALVNPVSTGGSNALRITYECETSALSGDTDEPSIPEPHQYLICYKAAFSLKISEGMDVSDLIIPLRHKERAFRIAMQERHFDPEGKCSVAGLIEQSPLTRFGGMSKS